MPERPDERFPPVRILVARPRLSRGHGFGNRLFPWARARVFATVNGAQSVAPRWTRWAVGPLLRGGIARRHYRTQILLLGILRAAPGDLSVREARRLAARGTVLAEPVDPRLPYVPPEGARGPIVVDFVGYEGFFAPLIGFHRQLAADLRAIVRPRWLALADAWGDVPIAINVRCGRDFARPRPGVTRLKFGEATPLPWFVEVLRQVRAATGRAARAFIVSDGTPSQLAPLLAEPEVVLVRPGCAASDLLVLAKARVLLASGSSSFSAWGAFLGQMPAAWHPGQGVSGWQLPGGLDAPPRVEFAVDAPDPRFLDAACRALRAPPGLASS